MQRDWGFGFYGMSSRVIWSVMPNTSKERTFLHLHLFEFHFFMDLEALKIKETQCFSTSGATYPLMQAPNLA